jgi:hypothetical protein
VEAGEEDTVGAFKVRLLRCGNGGEPFLIDEGLRFGYGPGLSPRSAARYRLALGTGTELALRRLCNADALQREGGITALPAMLRELGQRRAAARSAVSVPWALSWPLTGPASITGRPLTGPAPITGIAGPGRHSPSARTRDWAHGAGVVLGAADEKALVSEKGLAGGRRGAGGGLIGAPMVDFSGGSRGGSSARSAGYGRLKVWY